MQSRSPVRAVARPTLRQMVQDASRALASLDADRLEELAAVCAVLLEPSERGNRARNGELVREAQEAAADMALFGRVLEVTRSNLEVMRRLRDLRQGLMEYGQSGVPAEKLHGID